MKHPHPRRGNESGLIRPSHGPLRGVLRVAGPLIFLVGLIFMAVGLIDFFGAMTHSMRSGPTFGGGDTAGVPDKFWCLFVGMPLLAVGGWLTMAGFAGAIARYAASETAPVGKDTFNYLARGTREGVTELVGGVADGLRGGAGRAGGAEAGDEGGVACGKCGTKNDAGSRFCDQCGQPLPLEIRCPSCQAVNDADARYCDGCGAALG